MLKETDKIIFFDAPFIKPKDLALEITDIVSVEPNIQNDLVAGIFVGFDDPRPLGYKETGSSVAAPIFKDFMNEALDNTPDLPFRRPAGIKLISVNPKTGFNEIIINKILKCTFPPKKLNDNVITQLINY